MLGALQTITNSPESGFRNHSVDACHKRALQNLPVLPELVAQSLLKTVEFILALSMIISYQSKSRVYPKLTRSACSILVPSLVAAHLFTKTPAEM